MTVTELDLRILNEVAYSNLNSFFEPSDFNQGINLAELKDLALEIHDQLKNEGSTLKTKQIAHVLSKWEFCASTQTKVIKELMSDNPLLDAFAFRCKESSKDIYVIAFRGSNPKDKNQWNKDMEVNLAVSFIEQVKDNLNTQINVAWGFVQFILQKSGYFDKEIMYNDNYDGPPLDFSNEIYLTGHSKGGGLVQQVVMLQELVYHTIIKGVTFSATPILELDYILNDLITKGVIKNTTQKSSFKVVNYILKHDMVVLGLNLKRYFNIYLQLKSENINQHEKDENYKYISRVKLIKGLKFFKPSYVGEKIYLNPKRITQIRFFKKPFILMKKHGLSWFDKYFATDGKIYL